MMSCTVGCGVEVVVVSLKVGEGRGVLVVDLS